MDRITKELISLAKLINLKKFNHNRFGNIIRNGGECTLGKFSPLLKKSSRVISNSEIISLRTRKCLNYHIIYLHGGSYIEEPIIFHRLFIEKLVFKYKLKVSFINYPLAPEKSAKGVINSVFNAYKDIVKGNDHYIIMGDSAGGGLALALLELIRNKKEVMPHSTVLISPWLDISLNNKDIINYIDKDILLDLESLKNAGDIYRHNLDYNNYLVSPINGQLNNLGYIYIFVGSNEIFYPDCIKFYEKINNKKKTHGKIIIGDGLFHDYLITPLKESEKQLNKLINDIIKRKD